MRELISSNYLMALNGAYSMCRYGGYSAKLTTLEEPTKGYMVALHTIKIYPNISSVNVHEMTTLLREFCKGLDESILYIGSWVNPDTKELYFEVSLNIDNLDKARNIGGIHNQTYIWDVENKENIKL